MHLRQPGFTYSACGLFTKNREIIHTYKEIGDSRYIYQNKLDKTCFQQTWLMEILRICLKKQFPITYYVINDLMLLKTQNMMDITANLRHWSIIFFDKKSSGSNTSGGAVKSSIMPNQELAEELHKAIIRKFDK